MNSVVSDSDNVKTKLLLDLERDPSSYETAQLISHETHSSIQDSYTIKDAVNAAGFGKFQYRLLILSSFSWVAEACEIMILSLLGGFLACEWLITSYQVAVLTSVVFIAMSVGAPVLGLMADKYGRKMVTIGSTLVVVMFGFLSAAAPSIEYLITFRGILGFFVHGLSSIIVIYTEYLPTKGRGQNMLILNFFWSFGAIAIIFASMIIMTTIHSWRLVLIAAVIPTIIFLFLSKWYPKSARHMLICGKHDQAKDALLKMAEINGKRLPSGNLSLLPDELRKGSLFTIFKANKRIFILLNFIWITVTFVYYGIALLAPEIILHGGLSFNSTTVESEEQNSTTNSIVSSDYLACMPLLTSDYIQLVWTTASEIPGIGICWFLVERFSRRMLLFVSFMLYTVSALLLATDCFPTSFLYVLLFIARGTINVSFAVCVIYTLEVYPTTNRALALGFHSGLGRFGAIITPFVAQVLMKVEPKMAVRIYAVISGLTALMTLALPRDTKGYELEDH
ncbi:synaptic vesicle 2-related protein-like [Tachypleus tridentatus]|uniref:synaptic vesicle 2-related protein-like n=1 Tax=Tachypleus tridentatus TaxID=6853 RepID=UPI003FD524C4